MQSATFVGIGDIHGNGAAAARIPEIATADAVLVTGDITNLGGPDKVGKVLDQLRGLNPNVYAQIGNMDQPQVSGWLTTLGINLHRTVLELAPGLKFLGIGFSAITPFRTPSEVPDTMLGEWLEETARNIGEYTALVLVSHTPPLNTATDRLASGVHVGSRAVREFIERMQPQVCLTGHIHESRDTDTLGPTTIVNTGMLADGGYALLTYDGKNVKAELKSFK